MNRTRRRWLTGLAVTVLLLCVAAPMTGLWALRRALGPQDGDDLARDMIRRAAGELEEELGYRNRARNAETVAAQIAADALRPEGGLSVEPVAWSGRITGSEHASVDVRFTATVESSPGMGFGDGGNTAGSATLCFRYLLQLYRYTQREEIDCPPIVDPPVPTPEVVPTLPGDAQARLEGVLRSATADSLAADLRTAFPEPHVSIDSAAQGGELVAAVGVPGERECVVGVRQTDGSVEFPGYDRIWLEPGEVGCRVALYLAPPR